MAAAQPLERSAGFMPPWDPPGDARTYTLVDLDGAAEPFPVASCGVDGVAVGWGLVATRLAETPGQAPPSWRLRSTVVPSPGAHRRETS